MMGMQVAAPQLFYDFCLDDYVPGDHLLRRIDRFVDLESVRAELRPFYRAPHRRGARRQTVALHPQHSLTSHPFADIPRPIAKVHD